jgi:hypothetical protein
MLNDMLEMAEVLTDGYVRIVIALHDALAYKSAWTGTTSEQFCGAAQILRRFKDGAALDEAKITKAIGMLCDLGFDVLPIELEFDLDFDMLGPDEGIDE